LNVATGYLGLWKPINILGNKVFLIQYHLVWCLKGRKPVLVGKVRERLEQMIRQVADELGI
jgi:REP element-mobilizing transposase RayT